MLTILIIIRRKSEASTDLISYPNLCSQLSVTVTLFELVLFVIEFLARHSRLTPSSSGGLGVKTQSGLLHITLWSRDLTQVMLAGGFDPDTEQVRFILSNPFVSSGWGPITAAVTLFGPTENKNIVIMKQNEIQILI